MAGPSVSLPTVERMSDKQNRIVLELKNFLLEIEPQADRLPREVLMVLRYIHQHIFDPEFSVSKVKSGCGIRNNNVSIRFRVSVGVGMRDYIERLRLRAAKRLLRWPTLEIYLIAMAIGYEHQETFYRAFRRCYGCTPMEYRLEYLGE